MFAMEDYLDHSTDTSNSDKTIIVENEEINNLLKKYGSGETNLPSASSSRSNVKNIYNLDDFSDEDCSSEPLESRINRQPKPNKVPTFTSNTSWQDKFSADDFFEDSNDIDAVLNKISQIESEARQSVSKEVESLITSDIIERPKATNRGLSNDSVSDEESSDGFDLVSEIEKIKTNIRFDTKLPDAAYVNDGGSSAEQSSEDVIAVPKPNKIRKKNPADKETQRIEKEAAKAAKAKEREQKKLEKENQKQLKNALKVVENCVKPDQCIQYLTVNIDDSIAEKLYGNVITTGLKSYGYKYKISKQLVPNSISWTRQVPTIENMFLQNVHQQENHYMLIMDMPEFIQHIGNSTLTGHIQSLLCMPQIQHLSIALLGLQRYYKYLRDEKNREFKAAVAEVGTKKNSNLEFRDLPKINKKDIERKIVELQVFCKNIYMRPVEKFEDLVLFVGECTKSVAQIPYKQAKTGSLNQENELFMVNNRDCVRVDKDGNGLSRLWNQFLRMFPLASLETAEAVTSVYPTIRSLMEAYDKCSTPEVAEKLLQDLPVRRAAGPLGGQRKLGPEFSKRVYKFFCSTENVLL